jgi:hypothetical protein
MVAKLLTFTSVSAVPAPTRLEMLDEETEGTETVKVGKKREEA